MEELLCVNKISVTYKDREGIIRRNKNQDNAIIKNLSFSIRRGEAFGLIGESGCGKTTTARAITGLVRYEGDILLQNRNLKDLDRRQRGRELQLIFQNPYTSLNPKMKVKEILEEPLLIHKVGSRRERLCKIDEILSLIGFEESFKERYIDEMSGGQRQRIAIGCALILPTQLIVADEALASLDVSVQASIINLIMDINKKRNIAFLHISHDINVVAYLCDRIGVMYKGKIVEMGDAMEIYKNPLHPYTKLLLQSVPDMRHRIKDVPISPKAKDAYKGEGHACAYAAACPYYESRCRSLDDSFYHKTGNHEVWCASAALHH